MRAGRAWAGVPCDPDGGAVSELLTRVRDFYVAPAACGSRSRTRPATAPAAAVLGAPRPAAVLASGVALALARAGGSPAAIVALWRTGERRGGRVPARKAARRLAVRLVNHGLEADASGRLTRLWLPDEATSAAATAERAIGSASVPVAVALAGPRDDEIEMLLRLQDVIVLALDPDDDPALSELARDSLAGLPARIVTCAAHAGPASRALALSGAAIPSGLAGALRPAVEAVG